MNAALNLRVSLAMELVIISDMYLTVFIGNVKSFCPFIVSDIVSKTNYMNYYKNTRLSNFFLALQAFCGFIRYFNIAVILCGDRD